MKDEIVETTSVHFYMALHLFLYVFLSVQFELGGVAVVHCLPKKKKEKKM